MAWEELNSAKCDDLDYIHILIASTDIFTCTEAGLAGLQ